MALSSAPWVVKTKLSLDIERCSYRNFPVAHTIKACLQCRRPVFNPWVRKLFWRREWQPTPVILPGESHGQRSLEGYSSWGHKELDTTEWLAQGANCPWLRITGRDPWDGVPFDCRHWRGCGKSTCCTLEWSLGQSHMKKSQSQNHISVPISESAYSSICLGNFWRKTWDLIMLGSGEGDLVYIFLPFKLFAILLYFFSIIWK